MIGLTTLLMANDLVTIGNTADTTGPGGSKNSKMHFASNRKHGLKIESRGLVTSTITRSAKNNQHTCTIINLGVWEISFEDCYPPCTQSIAVQD
jgi:hypothetical protein